MRYGYVLAIIAVVLLWGGAAHADGLVFRAKGCGNKVFVSSEDGFSVLTATGTGEAAADGDKLIGTVNKIGFAMLFDQTSGHSIPATVDRRGLDRAQIGQIIAYSCRSFPPGSFARGTIERLSGCRGKIFVETPQGYAVLERLSGAGLLAEGDEVSGDFNKPGRATVQVIQTGTTLTVFVDDFQLPKTAAAHRIEAACNSR